MRWFAISDMSLYCLVGRWVYVVLIVICEITSTMTSHLDDPNTHMRSHMHRYILSLFVGQTDTKAMSYADNKSYEYIWELIYFFNLEYVHMTRMLLTSCVCTFCQHIDAIANLLLLHGVRDCAMSQLWYDTQSTLCNIYINVSTQKSLDRRIYIQRVKSEIDARS